MAGQPSDERSRRRARWAEYRELAEYSIVGLVFPVALVVGYLLGRAVGSLFGAAALGGVIGGVFGLVAGFYNVYKAARRLDRRDRPGGPGPASGD